MSELNRVTPCSAWMLPGRARAEPDRRPRFVVLGGDGVGPEVMAAAMRVLDTLGSAVDIETPAHGKDTLVAEGTPFPEQARAACERADAVLFGACEAASVPILRYLRWQKITWANLRPCVSLFDDGGVDLVVVRELSEGLYPGREGELAELARRWPDYRDPLGHPLPREGKFALRVVTPEATRRIAAYAAELAAHRAALRGGRARLTVVTKRNVLSQTDGLFHEICRDAAAAVEAVDCDHLHVDEAARQVASHAEAFDVIVTSNLFGDILSDVASEAIGGMPVAPSAAVAESFAYFEPVHGSAPDLAGRDAANPFGALLSTAMALYYVGHDEESARLVTAVQEVARSGIKTGDMGGASTTTEVVEAVCARLSAGN